MARRHSGAKLGHPKKASYLTERDRKFLYIVFRRWCTMKSLKTTTFLEGTSRSSLYMVIRLEKKVKSLYG